MQVVPRAEAPGILRRGRSGRVLPANSHYPQRSVPTGSPVSICAQRKCCIWTSSTAYRFVMTWTTRITTNDTTASADCSPSSPHGSKDTVEYAIQGQAKAITFGTAADLAAQIHDIATDVTTSPKPSNCSACRHNGGIVGRARIRCRANGVGPDALHAEYNALWLSLETGRHTPSAPSTEESIDDLHHRSQALHHA